MCSLRSFDTVGCSERRGRQQWMSLYLLVMLVAAGAFLRANPQVRHEGPASSVEPRSASGVATASSNSIWSGVYSEAQAEKGRVTYMRACSSCHKDDLGGDGKSELILVGAPFLSRWNMRPLSDLYVKVAREQHEVTRTMMRPLEINETLAFLLKANGMPAGPNELSINFSDLERIVITASSQGQ